MKGKRKHNSETAQNQHAIVVRFPKSHLSHDQFHDLWGDATGDGADCYFRMREKAIRKFSKYTLAHLSYRIGMTDVLKTAERELGRDGTEVLLRALTKENRKRLHDLELRDFDEDPDEDEDEWEDDEDDEADPLDRFWRYRSMRRRRSHGEGTGPMFA